MREQPYLLTSKNVQLIIFAKDRFSAFRKFFLKIKNNEIAKDQIGQVVLLHEKNKSEGKEYGLRTVPSLWNLKIIDTDEAVANIRFLFQDMSYEEAYKFLVQCAKEDKKIVHI